MRITATDDALYERAVSAFSEVGATLGEDEDLDSFLHRLAGRLCSLLEIERCSIFLRRQDAALLHGAVTYTRDRDEEIKRLVSGTEADAFTREVLNTGRPVLIRDARSDLRVIRHRMVEWQVRSILGVPMTVGGAVIGVLYLDNADQRYPFTPAQQQLALIFAGLAAVAVAHAGAVSEMRRAVRVVDAKNRLLRRSAAIETRLTEQVLTGADVAAITRTLVELTAKPCAVLSPAFATIAAAAPGGESWKPSLERAEVRHSPVIAAALQAIDTAPVTVLPPAIDADLRHRTLVAPLSARGETLGYLTIAERPARFGPLDTTVALHGATVLALELYAEARALASERDSRSALAADLLRGGDQPELLQRRAAYLGVADAVAMAVCLFTWPADGIGGSTLATLAAGLGREHGVGTPLLAPVSEGIAAIVELGPVTQARAACDELTRACDRIAAEIGGGVEAAISTACGSLRELPRAYAEAKQVAGARAALGERGGRALSAYELGPARILLAGADPADVERLVTDALSPLLATSAGGALIETLGALFACTHNIARAAARLSVHENTVRYRLGRIEELTGRPLEDPEWLLTLQLAVTAHALSAPNRSI